VTLSELTASSTRLALVGLAKNTGKTETLTALLRELEAQGRCVGVTSVGRDGEERDAIDPRIEKPRVRLPAGSLVATTDALLRAGAIEHERLEDTGIRTPLGRVLIARLRDAGTIEVAGPSAAADVRAVSDAMLARGAGQVLIDGAVDRRAASSPEVCDGLVMATGAVLGHSLAEVVAQTVDAVELARLPSVDRASEIGRRLWALADGGPTLARDGRASQLVSERGDPVPLPRSFILTAGTEQLAQLLDANPHAGWLLVAGALPDSFLRNLLHPLRHRQRELVLVVSDPTKVFMWKRGPSWYERQGVRMLTLGQTQLRALTVNPVAPQSHRFDSAELRAGLAASIPDLAIFDVLDPAYRAAGAGSPRGAEPAR